MSPAERGQLLLFSLFGFYFEWGLSTKLINVIVQSHLFSRAELPAEIQTCRKDTDGLLRIPGVCLPLEQRACVRARPWPHEGRSLRHHWGSFHPKHPSKGFIYLQMKDEPFNPFLWPPPGLLTLSSVYVLTHKHPKFPLYRGFPSHDMEQSAGGGNMHVGKICRLQQVECSLCSVHVLSAGLGFTLHKVSVVSMSWK